MNKRLLFTAFCCLARVGSCADYLFVNGEQSFHIEGQARKVAAADFRRSERGQLHYADANASIFYTHYLCCDNALSFQLGATTMDLDWDRNPRFSDKTFTNGYGSIALVSTAVEGWRWVVGAGLTASTKASFGDSWVVPGIAWGRYSLCENLGVHVGFVGFFGFEHSKYVLPILGADWAPSCCWRINVLFPLDMSVRYLFTEHFTLSLNYAPFGEFYRFPRRATSGRGSFHDPICQVFSRGAELTLDYRYCPYIYASVGAGWNVGGWIYIKDHHNHHGKYFKFDSAPYTVARVGFTF